MFKETSKKLRRFTTLKMNTNEVNNKLIQGSSRHNSCFHLLIGDPLAKGRRLEELVRKALEDLRKGGAIRDYEDLTGKQNVNYQNIDNVSYPDFVVNENIAIECKNRNPKKRNEFNKTTTENELVRRFEGEWIKKLLIISKLEFYDKDEEVCRKMLKDNEIEVFEVGKFVTPKNKEEVERLVFQELLNRSLNEQW